jgi:conjugative relaxase-like TrwC/TraI family protein
MLNITSSTSPGAMIDYFGHGSERETVLPWGGKLAGEMGLSGVPDRKAWCDLVRGKTPDGKLTQNDREGRRCLYDLTFSPPKSFALMHQVFGDKRLPQALTDSVYATMSQAEGKVKARVTRKKKREDVTTGNLLFNGWYHQDGRPVNGIPDPGDHIHVTAMNATSLGGKRYAPEMRSLIESSDYLRAYFHNDLAVRCRQLGYETRKTATAFEIEGISDATIRKFSKRQDQIVKATRIKAPKARAAIAALTRERKREELTADKLFDEWLSRITPAEYKLAGDARKRVQLPELSEEHLENALSRMMNAYSRVTEEQLFTEAMKQGVGEVTPEGLSEALDAKDMIRAKGLVQTQENQRKERELVRFARSGGIVWLTGKPSDEAIAKAERKAGDAEWIGDAGKRSFRAIHEAAMEAKAEGKKLVLQGLAPKNAPEGHALSVLRDIAGLRPLDETVRAKRGKVLEVVRGFRDMVRHRMEVLRRLEWMNERGVDGVRREKSPAREASL